MGRAHVERDGVSLSHAAPFLLVGTMNPEEGELRPQLLDRFGLTVEVSAARDVDAGRGGAPAAGLRGGPGRVRRRDGPTRTPRSPHGIAAARGRCRRWRCRTSSCAGSPRVCAAFEVDGCGPTWCRPHGRARTRPGAGGRGHRAGRAGGRRGWRCRTAAAATRSTSPAWSEQQLERRADATPPDRPSSSPTTRSRPAGAIRTAAGGIPRPTPDADEPIQRRSRRTPARRRRSRAGAGRAPFRAAAARGCPAWARAHPGGGPRARSRQGRAVRPAADPPRAAGLHLRPPCSPPRRTSCERGRRGPGRCGCAADDLRGAVREGREGNLVLFVVDASGSMAARARMAAVNGAVLSLLRDAYQRRDKVGLITFRAADARAGAAADLVGGGRGCPTGRAAHRRANAAGRRAAAARSRCCRRTAARPAGAGRCWCCSPTAGPPAGIDPVVPGATRGGRGAGRRRESPRWWWTARRGPVRLGMAARLASRLGARWCRWRSCPPTRWPAWCGPLRAA